MGVHVRLRGCSERARVESDGQGEAGQVMRLRAEKVDSSILPQKVLTWCARVVLVRNERTKNNRRIPRSHREGGRSQMSVPIILSYTSMFLAGFSLGFSLCNLLRSKIK